MELDKNLIKILKHDFSDQLHVKVVEKDALEVLKEQNFDILLSNLPFFLTEDILQILSAKVKYWQATTPTPNTLLETYGSELVTGTGNEKQQTQRLFRKAIVSVHNDDNYSDDVVSSKYPHLIISTLCVLDPDDFTPRQPFASKVIVVLPKLPEI